MSNTKSAKWLLLDLETHNFTIYSGLEDDKAALKHGLDALRDHDRETGTNSSYSNVWRVKVTAASFIRTSLDILLEHIDRPMSPDYLYFRDDLKQTLE